jgi:hypothetical protein
MFRMLTISYDCAHIIMYIHTYIDAYNYYKLIHSFIQIDLCLFYIYIYIIVYIHIIYTYIIIRAQIFTYMYVIFRHKAGRIK